MNKMIMLMIGLFMSVSASGQGHFPTCADLSVEVIQPESPGRLRLVTRNTCYDCRYGVHGCLYSELILVQKDFPFDTLAASDCYCLFWQDPNLAGELQEFIIDLYVDSIPDISELEVRMRGCGCDVIPFSEVLSTEFILDSHSAVYLLPSPASYELKLGNIPPQTKYYITDLTGKIRISGVSDNSPESEIDCTHLENGIYFFIAEVQEQRINKVVVISK